MKTILGVRTLVAAALLVSPLYAANAAEGADQKDAAKPAPATAEKAPAPAPAADKAAAPAAAEKKDDVAPIKLESEADKFSYLIGADIGTNLKGNRIPFVRDKFVQGCKDLTAGKEPAMSDQDISAVIAQFKKSLSEQQPKDPNAAPVAITGDEKFLGDLSYIVGADTGVKLKQSNLSVNLDVFARAVEDVNLGRKLAMTDEEMQQVAKARKEKMVAEMKAQGDKNLADGKAFLAENAKKPGVKSTASGLQYLVVTEGKGEQPKANDTVKTHYRGTTIDGKEFDSSYKRNEPAEFPVDQVIKGWTEALQLMHVGDKWKLFIPSDLAYGERGAGADIGPNSVLIFDIELLEVMKAAAPAENSAPAADGTIKLDASTSEKK